MYTNVLNGDRTFCLTKHKSCLNKINVNKILGQDLSSNALWNWCSQRGDTRKGIFTLPLFGSCDQACLLRCLLFAAHPGARVLCRGPWGRAKGLL